MRTRSLQTVAFTLLLLSCSSGSEVTRSFAEQKSASLATQDGAFATLLYQEDFVIGARVLAHSLKATGTERSAKAALQTLKSNFDLSQRLLRAFLRLVHCQRSVDRSAGAAQSCSELLPSQHMRSAENRSSSCWSIKLELKLMPVRA